MSKRFAPLSAPIPGSRFANLRERLDAPLYAEMSDDDYPGAGSRSSRPVASAQTTPAKPKADTAIAVSKPTAADIAFAAKTNAKYRHAKVMESPHVKGRERQAEAMLLASCTSGSKYAEAKTIIDELARAPLDIQLAAVDAHLKRKAVDNVWARAYGIQSTQNATEKKPDPKSKPSEYDDIWQRAYSKPKIAPGNPA